MRPRAAVLASLVAALAAVAAPALAGAAPHHNHRLTIAVTPNPIVSGDGVLIYGQLNTSTPGGRTIVLYHRINPKPLFTVIGRTKTTSTGFYEFTRAEGVVLTNRNWYVRAPGLPGNIHSRTVHERVAAEVTLATPVPTSALTNEKVVFTGSVAPDHRGAPVLLQEQTSTSGTGWKTLTSGRLDAASQFSIPFRFRVPGDHTVRIRFFGDARNIAAVSDTQTVTVQEKEKPRFTIYTSAPIIDDGGSATITGVLSTVKPGAVPGVTVSLWSHSAGRLYAPLATTTTASDGSYTFTILPQHDEEYQARTASRASAQLFVGVRDTVSLSAGATTSSVGQSVTFSGVVNPDKAGHEIELQRLGADGHYHVVDVGFVNANSMYQFTWTFGTAGTKTFRVRIPGGPENVGGVSSPVSVAVSLPPVTSLPPAS